MGRNWTRLDFYSQTRNLKVPAILLMVSFLILLATSSLAQTTSGIRCQVKDQQGLAVIDAAVTITSQALGVIRTMKSDASGSSLLPDCPPRPTKSRFRRRDSPPRKFASNSRSTRT